jgi:hypothetical protein
MHASNEPLISIQRDWNGWRTAQVRLSALESVHWFRPSGAPRPLLHGYVSCERIVTGAIDHECAGKPRHRLLVCVLKCHTACAVYSELAHRADEQQRLTAAGDVPAN